MRTSPIQTQSDSIFNVTDRLQSNFQRLESLLKKMEASETDAKTKLMISAEIRHHIKLAAQTLEAACKQEAVDFFVDCVLDTMTHVGPTARKTFASRMSQKQSQLYDRRAALIKLRNSTPA